MALWVEDMLVRAFKTIVQTFCASLGATVAFNDIDWYMVIVASLGAGLMSIAMTLCEHFDNLKEENDYTNEELDDIKKE